MMLYRLLSCICCRLFRINFGLLFGICGNMLSGVGGYGLLFGRSGLVFPGICSDGLFP